MKQQQPSSKHYTPAQVLGKAPSALVVAISTIGLLTIAVATLLPILGFNFGWSHSDIWKYVYAAGALLFLIGKLFAPYTGEVLRIKRLYRIEAWSAVFFCVAAFFMFYSGDSMRDVWAFTLAGGALLVFTTIAIPMAVKKALKK